MLGGTLESQQLSNMSLLSPGVYYHPLLKRNNVSLFLTAETVSEFSECDLDIMTDRQLSFFVSHLQAA